MTRCICERRSAYCGREVGGSCGMDMYGQTDTPISDLKTPEQLPEDDFWIAIDSNILHQCTAIADGINSKWFKTVHKYEVEDINRHLRAIQNIIYARQTLLKK